MFAVARKSFEVFDNTCKKFVALKLTQNKLLGFFEAVSFGNKIYVFQNTETYIACYDVNKGKWSEESCEVTKDRNYYSCFVLPSY